jgi:hypothetical protein
MPLSRLSLADWRLIRDGLESLQLGAGDNLQLAQDNEDAAGIERYDREWRTLETVLAKVGERIQGARRRRQPTTISP